MSGGKIIFIVMGFWGVYLTIGFFWFLWIKRLNSKYAKENGGDSKTTIWLIILWPLSFLLFMASGGRW